ncbi:MAG: Photosystem I P700 chlorophyll a apoprotein A2 [Bacteroidia bacterium]|nr:MAG: Photosystem I P700 chlorophyll a apoprotein A2 [Bacteroidia bacterium]
MEKYQTLKYMNMINNNKALNYFLLIWLLIVSCSTSKNANGQQSVSKKAQSLFNEGLKFQSYGEYEQAINLFKQSIKKAPKFLNAYDALANTYQKDNQLINSKNTYLKLLSLKSDHFFGLYELGNIYFDLGNLDSSEFYYRRFLRINSSNDKYAQNAQLNLRDINFSRDAFKNPVNVNPVNMGSSINSENQEYSPAFAIDEKTIYITKRMGNLSDNRPNEDLYFAELNDESWDKVKDIGPPINTIENEGAFSISSDGNYIFFTSCSRNGGKGQCDIWLTSKKNNRWDEPKNLQSPINTKYWESQPSISSDGRMLYFSSDRPGGYGGTDIWVSEFSNSGWSAPKNLGPTVNTSKDEQFPFIHSDNRTLYFSSNGHPGLGKSDLYLTRKDVKLNWETPINMGFPINSRGQDWNLVVARDGKTAYFSSNQLKGFGGLDIYTFQLPEKLQAEKVSYLRGYVRDAITKQPLSANVELSPINGEPTTLTYAKPGTGMFLVPLKTNMKYALTIDKDGYLFYTEFYNMPAIQRDQPIELIIDLEKIELGNSVVLKNIFFDTDKSDIKDESKQELEKLIDFLSENNSIRIEISGHTDNVGDSKHNMVLSENRAKSVCDFLTNNGIEKSRLTYKGFGDTQPIKQNNTDENRAKNRRTEFKIIQT